MSDTVFLTVQNETSVVQVNEHPVQLLATNFIPVSGGGAGTIGATGPSGSMGPQGPSGIDGATGLTGATGVQGPTGLTGATGIQGPVGATGIQGIQGPVGATGIQGIEGPQGATGLQGPQGIQGPSGSVGPAGATGATGIQGPVGATGIQGPQGATGIQGPSGSAGPIGATGVQGPSGSAGPVGATGIQGPSGSIGATGVQGPSGAIGATGVTGPAGSTSFTGLTDIPTGLVSSSLQATGWTVLSSSFAQNAIQAVSASWAPSTEGAPTTWASITDKPSGLVSSSTQVDFTQLQNIPVGLISSSAQVNTILDADGVFSSSAQVQFSGISGIPAGLVSSSTQVTQSIVGTLITPATVTASVAVNTPLVQATSVTASFLSVGSTATSLRPDTDALRDLGTPQARWNTIFFANTLRGPSVQAASGSVTGALNAEPASNRITVGPSTDSVLSLVTNNTVRWIVTSSNNPALYPNITNTSDLGLSTNRVRTVWTTNISSSTPISSASFATSASRATTASFALNAGTPAFPFTGSAIITGSLFVSGGMVIQLPSNPTLTIQGNTSPTLTVQGTGGTGSLFVGSDVRVGAVSNLGLSFIQNNAVAWYIDTNKHLIPNTNNTFDIGTNSVRVRNVFATSITSSNPIASASYALSASWAPSAGGSSTWASITDKPSGLVSSSAQVTQSLLNSISASAALFNPSATEHGVRIGGIVTAPNAPVLSMKGQMYGEGNFYSSHFHSSGSDQFMGANFALTTMNANNNKGGVRMGVQLVDAAGATGQTNFYINRVTREGNYTASILNIDIARASDGLPQATWDTVNQFNLFTVFGSSVQMAGAMEIYNAGGIARFAGRNTYDFFDSAYTVPLAAISLNGTQGQVSSSRFTGTSLNIAGLSSLQGVLEKALVTGSASSGSINVDVLNSTVYYFTGSATNNFRLNFRGDASTTLNSVMSTGQALSVVFLNTNGSTGYYPSGSNATQIDGSNVTVRWQGVVPTGGNSGSIDAYTYTILKTANAAFTVLGAQTRYL